MCCGRALAPTPRGTRTHAAARRRRAPPPHPPPRTSTSINSSSSSSSNTKSGSPLSRGLASGATCLALGTPHVPQPWGHTTQPHANTPAKVRVVTSDYQLAGDLGRRPRATERGGCGRCGWVSALHRVSHAATDGSGWGDGGRGHGKPPRAASLATVTLTVVEITGGSPCRTSLRRARGNSFIIEWCQITLRGGRRI